MNVQHWVSPGNGQAGNGVIGTPGIGDGSDLRAEGRGPQICPSVHYHPVFQKSTLTAPLCRWAMEALSQNVYTQIWSLLENYPWSSEPLLRLRYSSSLHSQARNPNRPPPATSSNAGASGSRRRSTTRPSRISPKPSSSTRSSRLLTSVAAAHTVNSANR